MNTFRWLMMSLMLSATMGVASAYAQSNNQATSSSSDDARPHKHLPREILVTHKEKAAMSAGQVSPDNKKNLAIQSIEPMIPDNDSVLFAVAQNVKEDTYQTALNYINGITVTTSPILGLKSAWNASDLLYQVPSMNQDMRLLIMRQHFQNLLLHLGSTLDVRPLLVFSGAVEGTVLYNKDFSNQDHLDTDLNTVTINIWPIMSSWANGFVAINFDNSPPELGEREVNSRLYVQRAFVTIGNLNKTPVYFTMGQMYVPFGRYSSAMISAPLTLTIGRTLARSVLLGLYHRGFYAQAYGFRGARRRVRSVVYQGGLNVGYMNDHLSSGGVDGGVGYISNMADALGMQNNSLAPGGPPSVQFAGFAVTRIPSSTNPGSYISSDNLKHNVGGINAHLELSLGPISFLSELVSAARSFNPGDLLYNNHGARPTAMHAELDYNFEVNSCPVLIGAAYGQSWQALPLAAPRKSLFATVSTSIWKNTVQQVEFRHDINYPVQAANSVGGGGVGNTANVLPVPDANIGGTDNTVTFMLGAYF